MQKINLYKPSFKPKGLWLKVGHMIAIVAMFVLIFTAISGYSFVKNKFASIRIEKMIEKKNKIQREWEVLQASLPEKGLEESLTQRAESLGRMKVAREKMFNELEKLHKGERAGFARYLLTLSKYDIEGIWLTKFEFTSEGKSVVLQGSANDVALIPLLVEKIGQDPIFKGKQFETLKIFKSEKDNGVMNFILSSN